MEEARRMGVRAFQEGRSGASAQDRGMTALIAEGKPDGTPYMPGEPPSVVPMLKAFSDAWHVEQRKAADERLRAAGFPLPRG